jgi:hypothetical protein
MGKNNTITEDDLLAGVGGGFGSIGQMGAGRPIRDNPFRETRTESPAQARTDRRPEAQAAPAVEQPAKPVARSVVVPAQQAPQPAEPESVAPQVTVPARPTRLRPLKKLRKTDTYSEKISTFLSPQMRDELEMTARQLQRNRLVKGDSITVHTLIRCGVRVLTELLEFSETDTVSSEEELAALVRKKLGR